MNAADLTQILVNASSPDANVRGPAEQQLRHLQENNLVNTLLLRMCAFACAPSSHQVLTLFCLLFSLTPVHLFERSLHRARQRTKTRPSAPTGWIALEELLVLQE